MNATKTWECLTCITNPNESLESIEKKECFGITKWNPQFFLTIFSKLSDALTRASKDHSLYVRIIPGKNLELREITIVDHYSLLAKKTKRAVERMEELTRMQSRNEKYNVLVDCRISTEKIYSLKKIEKRPFKYFTDCSIRLEANSFTGSSKAFIKGCFTDGIYIESKNKTDEKFLVDFHRDYLIKGHNCTIHTKKSISSEVFLPRIFKELGVDWKAYGSIRFCYFQGVPNFTTAPLCGITQSVESFEGTALKCLKPLIDKAWIITFDDAFFANFTINKKRAQVECRIYTLELKTDYLQDVDVKKPAYKKIRGVINRYKAIQFEAQFVAYYDQEKQQFFLPKDKKIQVASPLAHFLHLYTFLQAETLPKIINEKYLQDHRLAYLISIEKKRYRIQAIEVLCKTVEETEEILNNGIVNQDKIADILAYSISLLDKKSQKKMDHEIETICTRYRKDIHIKHENGEERYQVFVKLLKQIGSHLMELEKLLRRYNIEVEEPMRTIHKRMVKACNDMNTTKLNNDGFADAKTRFDSEFKYRETVVQMSGFRREGGKIVSNYSSPKKKVVKAKPKLSIFAIFSSKRKKNETYTPPESYRSPEDGKQQQESFSSVLASCSLEKKKKGTTSLPQQSYKILEDGKQKESFSGVLTSYSLKRGKKKTTSLPLKSYKSPEGDKEKKPDF